MRDSYFKLLINKYCCSCLQCFSCILMWLYPNYTVQYHFLNDQPVQSGFVKQFLLLNYSSLSVLFPNQSACRRFRHKLPGFGVMITYVISKIESRCLAAHYSCINNRNNKQDFGAIVLLCVTNQCAGLRRYRVCSNTSVQYILVVEWLYRVVA